MKKQKKTKTKPLRDLTVKDMEKDLNIDLGKRGNMKMSTYFKREGYPSLASLIEES